MRILYCQLLLLFCCLSALHWCGAQNNRPIASLERTGTISVSESIGTLEVCIVLDRRVSVTSSVLLIASTASATDGVDFVAVETILNFTSNGGTKTCTDIMILNDNVEEGNEPDRFFVRLQSTGDIQTSTAGLLVEIQDDDILSIGFAIPVIVVTEMEGSVFKVCARIVDEEVTIADGVSASVNALAMEGTATVADYSLSGLNVIVFTATSPSSVCTNYSIQEDRLIEGLEYFTVSLQQNENSLDVQFVGDLLTVNIQDNDNVVLVLNEQSYQITEGNINQRTNIEPNLCVILQNVRDGLERNVIISITTRSSNFAINGVDYEINQTSITIPNGTLEDEEYCITITIIGDDQMESNEVFEVTFTPQNEVDVFNGPPTVSITIMDDGDVHACRTLSNPEFGMVSLSGDNSIARYTCNQQYILVPPEFENRICLENDWSGAEPECVLTCPQLTFDNGVIVVPVNSNLRVGTVAIYMCNEGLILEGIKNRTCQANGFWSGNEPVCRGPSCEFLSNPPNGGVIHDGGTDIGAIAKYACINNFLLVGSTTRTCMENGNWSGVEPTCIADNNVTSINNVTGGTEGITGPILVLTIAILAVITYSLQ